MNPAGATKTDIFFESGFVSQEFIRQQTELYENVPALIPGSELIFMNHGFSRPGFAIELEPEDRRYLYHLNLLFFLADGHDLKGKKVLEVGSGRGGNCYALKKYFAPAKVIGMDLSKGNVEFCRRVHGGGQVEFVQGDATQLPFGSGEFDAVFNVESSHCYPDLGMFYSETLRVLKPGGTFHYTDCLDPRLLVENSKKLQATGFQVTGIENISSDVLNGLSANWESQAEMIRGAARGHDGLTLAESIIKSIAAVKRSYEAGQLIYVAWECRKPRSE